MTRRCLVVDDADDVRLLICLGLGWADFEVVAEADGAAAALDAARASQPDVVLLDLMLPDADGFDTITKLRGILPHAQIVVCSGLPAASAARASMAAGADHYLEKTALLDIGKVLADLLPAAG
jgi:CheY-like chemotaxis protein